jgi:chorismate mutase
MIDEELKRLRQEIDAVDNQILHALAKRFDLVQEIGKYKRDRDVASFDRNRFQQLMDERAKGGMSLALSEAFVRDLFARIHDQAVEMQEKNRV